VKPIFRKWFRKYKSRNQRRLDKSRDTIASRPILTARTVHYEVSDKAQAINCGGIGAIHALARRYGLIQEIDQRLHLLKFHLPYHESDHVLTIAYNVLCGGTCLEDLELRRNDANFLDALGARRIPDPTTAGDFRRRFTSSLHIDALLSAINAARRRVWAEQPTAFFDRAIIDMDGTLVETTGRCKQGMDIAYDGTWGYHPLVVSLANTGEVLSLVNRSGNRPSHEGAAREVNRSLWLCLEAGFRQVLLRGDTDFSQTEHLDGWDAIEGVRFIFGYDATTNLQGIADDLPVSAWRKLERPARYEVKTQARRRPENVKGRVVRQRRFETLRLQSEDVAEFDYRPTACRESYRMVVVRKNITKEKGETALFDDIRYFFYITNERKWSAEEVVFSANDRCNQENLIAQLKGGVRSLQAPVDRLESNWAYMVMTALAWNLKAWFALALPEAPGRWEQRHRQEKREVLGLEFHTFRNAFVLLPCQIVKTARKVVYRILSWSPRLDIFFRLITKLQC
jgi:Transposase DDE domain group 1